MKFAMQCEMPKPTYISSALLSLLNLLPKQSDIILGGQNPRNFGRIYRKFHNGTRNLIETGFEYVTDVDGVKLFRKRK